MMSIGIDPGTTTGWAMVMPNTKGQLTLAGRGHIKRPKSDNGDWLSYVRQVRELVQGWWSIPDRIFVAVEGQYIGSYTDARGVRRPVAGSLVPAQIAGIWMGAISAVMDPDMVHQYQPDEWRRIIWPDMRRMKRNEAKEWAVRWAQMTFQVVKVTRDEADAIGLAVCGMLMAREQWPW